MTVEPNVSYTFEDLGAVLHMARLSASEVMSTANDAWLKLNRSARNSCRDSDCPRRHQLLGAPDFLYSHMRSALYSAVCYFRYAEIFESLSGRTDKHDIEYAAIDAAHVFADVVPIDLFNAMKTSSSPEMMLIAPEWAKQSDQCFVEIFPYIKEARDAVTHAHDRQFARYGSKALPDADVGGGPLARNGKRYTNHQGERFVFEFERDRFDRLLRSFASLV